MENSRGLRTSLVAVIGFTAVLLLLCASVLESDKPVPSSKPIDDIVVVPINTAEISLRQQEAKNQTSLINWDAVISFAPASMLVSGFVFWAIWELVPASPGGAVNPHGPAHHAHPSTGEDQIISDVAIDSIHIAPRVADQSSQTYSKNRRIRKKRELEVGQRCRSCRQKLRHARRGDQEDSDSDSEDEMGAPERVKRYEAERKRDRELRRRRRKDTFPSAVSDSTSANFAHTSDNGALQQSLDEHLHHAAVPEVQPRSEDSGKKVDDLHKKKVDDLHKKFLRLKQESTADNAKSRALQLKDRHYVNLHGSGGNLCYMIATIQGLFHVKSIREEILKLDARSVPVSETLLISEFRVVVQTALLNLQIILQEMLNGSKQIVEVQDFADALGEVYRWWRLLEDRPSAKAFYSDRSLLNTQQDLTDFMSDILSDNGLLSYSAEFNSEEHIRFSVRRRTVFKSNGSIEMEDVKGSEPIITITPSSNESYRSTMLALMERVIEGEGPERTISDRFVAASLPKVLAVRINSIGEYGSTAKQPYLMDIEKTLDLTPLVDTSSSSGSANSERYVYELISTQVHYGSFQSGHWCTYAKCEDGKWRRFDDVSKTHVPEVSLAEVLSPDNQPAFLFYKRVLASSFDTSSSADQPLPEVREVLQIQKVEEIVQEHSQDDEVQKTASPDVEAAKVLQEMIQKVEEIVQEHSQDDEVQKTASPDVEAAKVLQEMIQKVEKIVQEHSQDDEVQKTASPDVEAAKVLQEMIQKVEEIVQEHSQDDEVQKTASPDVEAAKVLQEMIQKVEEIVQEHSQDDEVQKTASPDVEAAQTNQEQNSGDKTTAPTSTLQEKQKKERKHTNQQKRQDHAGIKSTGRRKQRPTSNAHAIFRRYQQPGRGNNRRR